jgi:hypothetical protein
MRLLALFRKTHDIEGEIRTYSIPTDEAPRELRISRGEFWNAIARMRKAA